MKKILSLVTAGALALSVSACYTAQDRAAGGAVIGGLTGAAIGAAVGAATAPAPDVCPYGYYRASDGLYYCR
jgi:osmotically inducible lipoprotein OsmB